MHVTELNAVSSLALSVANFILEIQAFLEGRKQNWFGRPHVYVPAVLGQTSVRNEKAYDIRDIRSPLKMYKWQFFPGHGAEGGGRTLTSLRTMGFESIASASSATSAFSFVKCTSIFCCVQIACDTMSAMSYQNDSIFWVELYKIVPNPYQPRREFDEQKLKELSESIRMYGLLQPITVTRKEISLPDGAFRTEYELIAGERRLRAAKLAGLSQIPVIIRTGEESDLMKLELAIIENLQREDLNPIDRAGAFHQLAEQFKLSHSQVAVKVGRSREFVSNTIRLLQLPPHMLEAVQKGEMTEGHGRALLMLSGREEEMETLFREILLKKLSVREVERISRKIAVDRVRKKEYMFDPELIEMEKQFTESLGTRVQIEQKDFGGKLVIDFFSPDDLRKILALVITPEKSDMSIGAFSSEEEPALVSDVPDELPADDRSRMEQEDSDLYAITHFSL